MRLGRNPASVLPPPVGATSRTDAPALACSSRTSWCSRGRQPRAVNHCSNRGGNSGGKESAKASMGRDYRRGARISARETRSARHARRSFHQTIAEWDGYFESERSLASERLISVAPSVSLQFAAPLL